MSTENNIENIKPGPRPGTGGGGSRPGCGRKKGTGIVAKNKTVRVPTVLLDEAKRKKVKNITKIMNNGLKAHLKRIPDPDKPVKKSKSE